MDPDKTKIPAEPRDYAAELRVMPTSEILIMMAHKGDRDEWVGNGREPDGWRARLAICAEIDRRIPVPA